MCEGLRQVDPNQSGFLLFVPAEIEQNILVIAMWTGGGKRESGPNNHGGCFFKKKTCLKQEAR